MRAVVFLLLIGGAGVVAAVMLAGALRVGGGQQRLSLPGVQNLPYSHAVVVGSTTYIAGTLGLERATGKPPLDPRAEAELALETVRRELELAGNTMDDLVSVQVFCTDLTLYDLFNEVYRTRFTLGYPARTFVGSGPLVRGGRFEISAVAVKR